MRFRGYVHPTSSLPHSITSGGAALIRIWVALEEGPIREITFLIDTGSDGSVLHPADAQSLLGGNLHRIDFGGDSRRVAGLGVGGAVDRVARDAALILNSADGETYSLEMPILIARPIPSEPGEHGNWRLPSLLGRDFLRHFRLELLCGDRRRVVLETL